MEIEHERVTLYDGNYSVYLKQKQENETYIARKYENTMREITRIEGIIEQQKRWNREKNIKTAESKQKQVDRLKEELVVPLTELENIKPRFEIKINGGNDVLEVQDLSKSFGETNLFHGVSFLIRRKEHAFLLGANGCGKTTLFKMIMGKESADGGSISIGANVEVGYFDQLQSTVSREKTLFDEISDTYPELTQTEIRNALAGFLFKSDDVFKLVGELSGGERARLMLLKLMLQKANFLLLDEPTNHLDIKSREMLEDALMDFPGTIFSISHDRYFINKLANRVLVMDGAGVTSFAGDYSYYLEKKEEQNKNVTLKAEKQVTSGKEDYLRQKQKDAEERKRKNRLSKVEQEIEETEKNVAKLTEELEKPENTTDYVKCAEISKEIEEKNAKLLELYEEWETLQE